MPLVNVKVLEGVFSAEKKQEIIRRVTNAMVEVEGENLRAVTWVVIEEVKKRRMGNGRELHDDVRCETDVARESARGASATLSHRWRSRRRRTRAVVDDGADRCAVSKIFSVLTVKGASSGKC